MDSKKITDFQTEKLIVRIFALTQALDIMMPAENQCMDTFATLFYMLKENVDELYQLGTDFSKKTVCIPNGNLE